MISKEYYPENSIESKKFLEIIYYLIANNISGNNIINSALSFYLPILNSFNFIFLKNGSEFPFFDLGTRIKENNIEIVINPNIFFKNNDTEMFFRLVHEIEHILQKHILFDITKDSNNKYASITRKYKDNDGNITSKIEKIPLAILAMDLEINSLKYKLDPSLEKTIFYESEDYLLEKGIFPLKKQFQNLEPYKVWEEYYMDLLRQANNNEHGFSLTETVNLPETLSTNLFGSCEFLDKDGSIISPTNLQLSELTDTIERVIKDAVKNAGDSTPERYKHHICNYETAKLKWEDIFSNYIKSGISSKQRNTKRKPNRRAIAKNAIIHGNTVEFDTNIIFCIDTSASISEETFLMSLSQLDKIRKSTQSDVHVLCFDTEVHLFEKLDIENHKNYISTKIGSSFTKGGTRFFPIYEFIKKKNISPDILIIYTDGYNVEGKFNNPLPFIQTLWVYTEDHFKHIFGNQLIIKK